MCFDDTLVHIAKSETFILAAIVEPLPLWWLGDNGAQLLGRKTVHFKEPHVV